MVFQDENPSERRAECTDEGEKRFRAEKERLLADCLVRHPMGSKAASFAGVDPKNLLSDGLEDVDEDEEETQWLRALEVVPAGWKAAAARLKSTGLRFMDESLASVQSGSFEGEKEWGSYTIGPTTITAMQMSAEHCEVEAIGNGLTITARGITGTFAPLEWSFKRIKVPRTEDAGKASAAFRDLAVHVMFDVDLESDDSSTGELVLGEADVQVRLENIEFTVTESGKNKRFANMFAATFKDALRHKVEEAMVAALSDLTELRTKIDRTLQELNSLILATPQRQSPTGQRQIKPHISAARAQATGAAADVVESEPEPEPEPEQAPSVELETEKQEGGCAEEGIPPSGVIDVNEGGMTNLQEGGMPSAALTSTAMSTTVPAADAKQELTGRHIEPKKEPAAGIEAGDSEPEPETARTINAQPAETQSEPNDDPEAASKQLAVAVGTEIDGQVAI